MKQSIWKAGIVVAVAFLLCATSLAGVPDTSSPSDAAPAADADAKTISLTFPLSTPDVAATSESSYVTLKMEDARYSSQAGKPMMPYTTTTRTFPLGTEITDVDVRVSGVQHRQLHRKIAPASEVVAYNSDGPARQYEGPVYDSAEPCPADWVQWHTGGGLQNGEHVTFLSLHVYPARYRPATGELRTADEVTVEVTYEPPATSLVTADEYDLLIVAPEAFTEALQPLVEHKEEYGVATKLVTTDEIYSGEYFEPQGRDKPEQLKYFIKNALDDWGITYVMLAGGKKSYLTGNWGDDGPTTVNSDLWHVPVRYVALNDQTEAGYLSDLYFADIYNATGAFSSWDSNDDGVYGAWSFGLGKDKLDGYPDVYLGRLACRSVREVETVVQKIITYESSPADPSWFNKMLLIGGDTFPGDQYVDGEVTAEHHFSYMPDKFEATKLFVTNDKLPLGDSPGKYAGKYAWTNTIKTWSDGYGIVALDGHGSPTAWATHFVNESEYWVNGLMTYNMDLLSNGDKQPVVTIGGCHNSEFNISLTDFVNNKWTYQPTYECWGWHIVKMRGGGAIASIGNTGLGYGATGDHNEDGIPDCVQQAGGYIEGRFYKAYGQDGVDVLGQAWGQAISEFNDKFPPLEDQIDTKTIEEWALLGDPSLKIGGYE